MTDPHRLRGEPGPFSPATTATLLHRPQAARRVRTTGGRAGSMRPFINRLTRKLGPRWARGSEPWPARRRGCGMALIVRLEGPGAGSAAAPGLSGVRALWSGGGWSGGLRRADGDGDGAAGVEPLQLALQG